MALVDLERRVVGLCFGPEPSDAELAAVGDPRVWRLYRRLVRSRLRDEHKRAFKRTLALIGREAFDAMVAHHLAHDPPRTRFFYGVPAELARGGVAYLRARPDLPEHAADLLAYESALWAVSDLPDAAPGELTEVAFERVPVMVPALRLLALDHPVHERDEAQAAIAKPTHLCVYRRAEDKRSRTWIVNGVTLDLLARFVLGGESIADSVRQVCRARGLVVDERFLDGLGTVLATAIQRGVLLGTRDGAA